MKIAGLRNIVGRKLRRLPHTLLALAPLILGVSFLGGVFATGPVWAQEAEGASTSQEANSPQDLAHKVAELLTQRCADCHQPGSDDPKAVRAWEDARDLAATVANEALIVPGDATASDLFFSIEFDDMPPSDAEGGPLSDEEKKWIADWIEAGAPLPQEPDSPADTSGTESSPGEAGTDNPEAQDGGVDSEGGTGEGTGLPSTGREPKSKGWMNATWPKYFGRFHPIAVHFPIALLTIAALAEMLARIRREPHLLQTAWFCFALGALSCIPAAVLGWIHAENTSHKGDDLFWHRWLGVAVTVLACAVLAFGRRAPKWRLPALLLIAGLVGIVGHYGGYLSFGRDWLSLPG